MTQTQNTFSCKKTIFNAKLHINQYKNFENLNTSEHLYRDIFVSEFNISPQPNMDIRPHVYMYSCNKQWCSVLTGSNYYVLNELSHNQCLFKFVEHTYKDSIIYSTLGKLFYKKPTTIIAISHTATTNYSKHKKKRLQHAAYYTHTHIYTKQYQQFRSHVGFLVNISVTESHTLLHCAISKSCHAYRWDSNHVATKYKWLKVMNDSLQIQTSVW